MKTELQDAPGVGPSIERDLLDLGLRSKADLRATEPDLLFEKLCTLRGERIASSTFSDAPSTGPPRQPQILNT